VKKRLVRHGKRPPKTGQARPRGHKPPPRACRAAGVNSNYQAIVSGLSLYIFIVLQSAVVWLCGRGSYRLALPSLLLPGANKVGNQG